MEPLTTIELLAIAVLKGDQAAARGFLDLLVEDYSRGIILHPNRISAEAKRIRVVAYFPADSEVDVFSTRQAIDNWLDHPETHLVLVGADRIELFEFPEGM